MSEYIHIKFSRAEIGIYKKEKILQFYNQNRQLYSQIRTAKQIDRRCNKELFDILINITDLKVEQILQLYPSINKINIIKFSEAIKRDKGTKSHYPRETLYLFWNCLLVSSFKYEINVTDTVLSCNIPISESVFRYITFSTYSRLPISPVSLLRYTSDAENYNTLLDCFCISEAGGKEEITETPVIARNLSCLEKKIFRSSKQELRVITEIITRFGDIFGYYGNIVTLLRSKHLWIHNILEVNIKKIP